MRKIVFASNTFSIFERFYPVLADKNLLPGQKLQNTRVFSSLAHATQDTVEHNNFTKMAQAYVVSVDWHRARRGLH